ncbi:ATP-NAD kinase [Candidatus Bathyarchaeota archaeon]|nr:ATP-NAD kinase [Candidatus Bathyarchaeota archaeon]
MKKLGLIVNPVAGLGGRVGLKGSDGKKIQEKAIELGAVPLSPKRTIEALEAIESEVPFKIITYPGSMGENEAKAANYIPEVIGSIDPEATSASDTMKAATEMLSKNIDLLLFAGGDGTARDIYEAIDSKVPVIGIPAGVKIHSGVFSINPRSAGIIAGNFLSGQSNTREAEVMDIDEEAFRSNEVAARLYGYMITPNNFELIQGTKEAVGHQEDYVLEAIALDIIENMDESTTYILGPGTSTRPIATKLSIDKTLLGVDLIKDKKLLVKDANEKQILREIEGSPTKIIISVIGGQGFIFGRGNQQISPKVIRIVGKNNLIIVATPEKLASLKGRPMRVDTGEPELDKNLQGFYRIWTGYGKRTVYRVR